MRRGTKQAAINESQKGFIVAEVEGLADQILTMVGVLSRS